MENKKNQIGRKLNTDWDKAKKRGPNVLTPQIFTRLVE